MIILDKKRIMLSLSILSVAIFTYIIQNANLENINKTVETVALPVSNKVIVIDARTWNTR